jgi:hypothetical protein
LSGYLPTLRASCADKDPLFGIVICLVARPVLAGDAIAIGYNYDGVWIAVTYNRSSTLKGGPHYRESAQACIFAMRDLRVRASDDLVRTKVIGQSDATGYVAVARGRAEKRNKDVTVIGRGNSQTEADENALQKLNDTEATTNQEIVYRYFSYGADSAPPPPPKKQQTKSTHRQRPVASN